MITWSPQFELEIAKLRAVELEALHEQLLLSKEKKLQMLNEILGKVKKNLLERDLSDLDSGQLFELLMKVIASLENPGNITFKEQGSFLDLNLLNTKTWSG